MKKPETAVSSFILLNHVSRLLALGYESGFELDYEIRTGRGYRISIVIEPPMESPAESNPTESNAPRPDEPIQTST